MNNDDFSLLEKMIYSGTGITIGMTPNGEPFMGISLTGREPDEQARKLKYNDNYFAIKPTDSALFNTHNAKLLLYMAMQFIDDDGNKKIIASNGGHLLSIARVIYNMESIEPQQILTTARDYTDEFYDGKIYSKYLPDAPHFTPRISGCIGEKEGSLYIVRKRPDNNYAEDQLFHIKLEPGQADTITTYNGINEEILLPFKETESLSAKIASTTAKDICESLYFAIRPKDGIKYRVAAAVILLKEKEKLEFAIINKSDRRIKFF